MNENTSVELVKAEINLELSKAGMMYQQLLQDSENVVFTRDNLNQERTALVNLRKVKSKLEAMVNPHTAAWKAWNDARKSVLDPIVNVLGRKSLEFSKLSNEIEAEKAKANAEKERIAIIKASIDKFFIDQSQAIANAKTQKELVLIEKLIGSHRANSKYAEFLPLLSIKASNLTDLIKKQKEYIKNLEALNQKESGLESNGQNDEEVLAIREEMEEINAKMNELTIKAQESAISMATNEPETAVEVMQEPPKARRTVLKWKIPNILDDKGEEIPNSGIKRVARMMPEWVEMIPNYAKINEYLKAKKLEDIKNDFEFGGIKFYLEKTY